jgi:electron transport complex protein RnfG
MSSAPNQASADVAGERRAWPPAFRSVIVLLIAIAIVGVTIELTRRRVAGNEAAQVRKMLDTVLLPGSYDNEPQSDRIFVSAPELLGRGEPLPVYRARKAGAPAAAVITAVAPQGYMGPIRMLVAVDASGEVSGVRVINHQETRGLGDRVDAARSPWIGMFRGRSLRDPEPARWALRRDGGEFDALSGATITSRAVIKAVRDAQVYFERHRDEIFAGPNE